ncbi:hypothetical protein Pcinc_031591 [Petrolisthes cinctipes]|uniref:Inorganic phosphate cotransporter n=1 Tax=Petrolisthes cinctipes TaxID=88211 RepID=A0AAE1K4M3_PETCI|nr:hypothetical protein Pcinc_031591 [Petrolisthes cinctipes]
MSGRDNEGLEIEEFSGEYKGEKTVGNVVVSDTKLHIADAQIKITNDVSSGPWWGVRHTLCLQLFLGIFTAMLVRVSLSIAIVAMVGTAPPANTTQNISDVCPPPDKEDGDDSYVEGDYDWDEKTQGLVLGAFYYGYTAGNFLGGRAAEYVGGRVTFAMAVMMPALLSLLSPLCASVSKDLLIVLRVLEGLMQVRSGSIIGSIVAMSLGGLLSNSQMGWQSVFYIFGGLGVLWGLPWYFLSYNLPEHHPRISEAELTYILKHRTYVKQEKSGLMSALPYVTQWVITVGWAAMVSFVMDRKLLSVNLTRKTSTAFAATLISMLWVDCNSRAALVVMCISVGSLGTINSGLALAEQDIAPNFAGSLKGITNTIGGANGFIAPAVTGSIINNNQTLSAWRTVFLVAASLSIICTTQFLILSTDKVQPWNEPKREDEYTNNNIQKIENEMMNHEEAPEKKKVA